VLASSLSLNIDSWLFTILLAIIIGLVIGFLTNILTGNQDES